MSEHRASRTRRRRSRSVRSSLRWWRSVPLRALLSLGLVLGVGASGTFAYWTDEAAVTGITFTAGRLDLELQDDADDTVSFTALNIATMIPGQSAAGLIKVENTGNVPFTYTATRATSGSSALADALQLKVTTGGTSGSLPNATCSGSTITGPSALSNTTLVGAARSLAAGSSENLCIEVAMPSNADSGLQNASTSVTLTFTATQ